MLPGLPGHGQSLTERSGTLILFILGSVLLWPGSAVYKQALCWLEVGGRGGGSQGSVRREVRHPTRAFHDVLVTSQVQNGSVNVHHLL